MPLKIIRNDITKVQCDAIVNARSERILCRSDYNLSQTGVLYFAFIP